MGRTRKQSAMEKSLFEELTTEQLHEEARKLGLSTAGSAEAVIDRILAHLEKPATSGKDGGLAERKGKGQPPSTGASEEASDGQVDTTSVLLRMIASMDCMLSNQREAQRQQQQALLQHQQQFNALLQALTEGRQAATDGARGTDPTGAAANLGQQVEVHSGTTTPINGSARSQGTPGNAPTGSSVKCLATQIPEFGGTTEDNVNAWVRRVDKVAQIHGAPDGVTLLAASSRLVKAAATWYQMQTGAALESWGGLRREILKIFERKVPFYKTMQAIEARKWAPAKETFDQYAIEKLALIQRLDLPDQDQIHLVIGGITLPSLRATALSITATTVESFLERMRHITEGMADNERRTTAPAGNTKAKDPRCRNCGKQGHEHKECKSGVITCFYCKKPGHRRYECPSLKNAAKSNSSSKPSANSTAASVTTGQEEAETVAAVAEGSTTLNIRSPIVAVSSLQGNETELAALVDTGSPVSFVKREVFEKHIKPYEHKLKSVKRNLKNLSDHALDVTELVETNLKLTQLGDRVLKVDLFVLKFTSLDTDLILGREFLEKQKLTLVYDPAEDSSLSRANMFAVLPAGDGTENERETSGMLTDDQGTDLEPEYRRSLENLLVDVHSREIILAKDDHAVTVNLKDESTYAYAPRRFAHAERLQVREITDDLMARGIIRTSTSPYCARVVPVRKKNGSLRLCIDLRPLNSRVAKQKYPFPLIEDCLSRLSNKTIFTLLDLKDGFHQINVHENSRKYFSFATPDGQFEYTKLPFGYCEAPAEFQKRLVQILSPLIRQDKVIVYIDDVLIATETAAQNLTVLKEVLLKLKEYGFQLNYTKCQFLKNKIEFLGYVISKDGITLSPRHTEAVTKYKRPRNVLELQRFLGLTNYFRKFIKNYAIKAKPLYELLRKGTQFNFEGEREEAFEALKRELASEPVLGLYDPSAETELHTDACAHGLGAVLLQRRADHPWRPVAYFSQATNQAESRYHSYELEMLAIVRAVERFHLYLYGLTFAVVTDCNALVYAINKANLNPRIARWTLSLQNYHFKVAHRPGNRMTHVDALSRAAAYVMQLPLERELEYRQLTDAKLLEISKKLEIEDSDKFALVDGLVYKIEGDQKKFAVPEQMVPSLIRAHHDDMAHCGLEKTLQGISQNFWFPSMRKRIIDYIENCFACLMSNGSTHRNEGETHLYPLPENPLDVIHIDHFGPLAEAKHGYKHVLVIIDALTRFTWLFAVKSTGTKEVINALKIILYMFGKPGQIVSDRGTAFTSNDFAEFLRDSNIEHRKVAVASPWANGLVERVNRFLKSSLIKLLNDPEEWKDNLDRVQYVLNNTYHSSIESTPSKLFLGFDHKNHQDVALARFTRAMAQVESDLQKERGININAAKHATELVRNYNKKYRDTHSKRPTVYEEGDYVLIRNRGFKRGENAKLKPNYKGPYHIHKSLGNNRYVVKDIPGFNLTQKPLDTILSSDKLKPWVRLRPPPEHDPEKGKEKET